MGKHHHPAEVDREHLSGVVRDLNFSPKGGIEGVLLDTDRGVIQVNLPPHQAADGLTPGRAVELVVEPENPGHHPPGDHPVYRLVSPAGAAGGGHDPDAPVRVEGVVVRINYARHGEANGVVLDTGDFIHLKPHGMRQTGLAVGQWVTAEGTTRPATTGRRVIEADTVFGVPVKKPHDR